MNIIETHDLCKQYGNALRVAHLDLDVPEGSVYGFLGPQRSGEVHYPENDSGLSAPYGGQHPGSGKEHGQQKPAGRAPAGREPY